LTLTSFHIDSGRAYLRDDGAIPFVLNWGFIQRNDHRRSAGALPTTNPVVDVETTGFHPGYARVVEIAAVVVHACASAAP